MIIGNLILAVLMVPVAVTAALLIFWTPATATFYLLEKKLKVTNNDLKLGS